VIDIGGGSTELVLGEGDTTLEVASLKIGAIRLTQRFLRGKVSQADIDAARTHLRSTIAPVAKRFELAGGFEVIVGSSGTIVNVAQMARAIDGLEPLQQVSNQILTAKAVQSVAKELTARTLERRPIDLPGLDPKRADIILGGTLVLQQAMRALDTTELIVSDYALREGLVLDVLRRRSRGSTGHLADLREQSVQHLLGLMPGEREHSERVAAHAAQLFEGTSALHGLGPDAEEWLQAAALLCNVGLAISHDRHHIHSYYVIRNTDLLAGFTDHEIEMIALVARYHRKSAPKQRHPEFARLSEDDQRIVRVLGGLLRVAVGLDRTRSGVVRSVTVEGDPTRRTVRVVIEAHGDDAEVEAYAASARRDLLADTLGIDLELQIG
jgi:exopolyphosphatase/guanosine-5'-triphosphate,3'-diphosphate pyrophosphatase